MSDDKADNNPAPEEEIATVSDQEAQTSPDSALSNDESQESSADDKMTGLMAEEPEAAPPAESGAAAAPEQAPAEQAEKPAVDLEAEAISAAQAAVAEGEKALADAQAELQARPAAQVRVQPKSNGRREFALRMLLAANILAMIVVSVMPTSGSKPVDDGGKANVVEPVPEPVVRPAPMTEPVNRAMQAAQNRDFANAVGILETYLNDTPLMHSAERLSVLLALSSYAARNMDFDKSRKYAQQAQSLEQSHYLPEDLINMAEAALASGDQETLRRTWARFLLQQRQIPSWLYQHVAKAYLQMGDSYRNDADQAAEAARLVELKAATARLRAEAQQGDKK